MSLHDDLVATARYLARRNNNRPSAGDLRRAVSTAYYALFHRLIDAAAARLVATAEQQAVLGRSFDHGKMRSVCQAIRKQPVPPLIAAALAGAIPDELKRVAEAFEILQQSRHDADYNRAYQVTVSAARSAVGQVETAFVDLTAVEGTPVGQAFLLLLLLGEPKAR